MLKRTLSLILSVIMVVSMLPAQVLAEEFAEQPTETVVVTEPEATSAPAEPEETSAPTEPEATEVPVIPTEAPAEPEATEVPAEEITEETGVVAEAEAAANAAPTSGTCGDNVTWSLDGNVLIISGTGPMDDGLGEWKYVLDKIYQINIESGVTTIGNSAFVGCPNLVIVNLPKGLTSIGDRAFENCSKLAQINIPAGVQSIGEGAFFNTFRLNSVSIPASVKTIGPAAFYNSGIQTLTLQEGLISIGKYAFENCTNLKEVTIPESVTTIGFTIFYGCNADLQITCGNFAAPDGWNSTWNHYASGKALATTFREASPEELFWASVDSSMESLTIPGYITEIPAGAFQNYTSLKTVTICDGVTTIGAKAFAGCTALELVNIPASVTTIAGEYGKGAFYGCNRNLVIYCDAEKKPAGWGEFWNAVYGEIPCDTCFGSIEITEHFWRTLDPTGVTHVVIPEGVSYIPEGFFRDSNIESVVIPDSVTTIEDYAFNSCGYLTEVQFGCGVKSIGQGAFVNTAITKLELPESLTSVGQAAFSGCNVLKEVILPESLTALPSMMFKGCGALNRVVLPDTLTTIGQSVFQASGLKAIFIPESVISISASTSSYSPFLSCSSDLTIFCAAESKPANWSSYWNNIYSSTKATVYYGTTQADADFWGSVDKSAESIKIPAGVTTIPSSAFESKTTLKQIMLPDTLTYIGSKAFKGCTGLTSIFIPESVKTIITSSTASYSPFFGCSSAMKIYCEAAEKPSGWGQYWDLYATSSYYKYLTTVYGYSRLDYEYWLNLDKNQETIVIPEGVTQIPSNAFTGNTTLKQITVPASVKTIGSSAFENCTALTKVVLNEGVTSIGGYAFRGCTALVSMPIPEGVTSIGMYAFSGCSALLDVTIPSTVTFIASDAFNNCTAMEIVHIADLEAWFRLSFTSTSSNPLASGAYLYVQGRPLTELTIPESVTKLNDYTFYGCEGLRKVTIPETVTTSGYSVFRNCPDLEEVCYNTASESMGTYLFSNATALKKVEFGPAVTKLPDSIFSGCTALTSVTLPDTIIELGESAFSGCSALSSVTLSNALEKIGSNAFYKCAALQSIHIPATVTTISASSKSSGPFYGCTNLIIFTPLAEAPSGWSTYWNNYNDSNKLTVHYNSLGSESEFWGSIDKTAETIEIPAGITRIPSGIFKNNTNLKQVIIPSSVTTIESSAFEGCSGLTSITIPGSVTSIGIRAFCGCTGLTEVNLPSSVSSIPDNCFYGCTALKTLSLPDGITSLGAKAFGNCTKLEIIYLPATVTSIPATTSHSYSPFYYCESNLVIYCEADSKPDGWGTYWNYIDSSSRVDAVYGLSRSDAEYWMQLDKTQSELTIPDFVTRIPDYVFRNNRTLTKLVIGSGVKTIDGGIFYNTNGVLTFVYVPKTVETVPQQAFGSPSSLKIFTDAESRQKGWHSLWNHKGIDSSVTYATTYNVNLQEAEYWAVLDKTQPSITLPSYIRSLPDSIFSGCATLTSLTLPEGLKTIGNKALYNCTQLETLYVPASVTSVAADAFTGSGLQCVIYDGTMMQWLSIHPANTVQVQCADETILLSGSCGEYATYTLTADGILRINGAGAMKDYANSSSVPWYSIRSSIREVQVGIGISSIGSYAFYDCQNLAQVSVAGTVTSIGSHAFRSCSSLAAIMLPDNLESIGSCAFYKTKLSSITIPASVTELGSDVFSNCAELQYVSFLGNGVEALPSYLFYNCNKLQNFTIPGGVKTIGVRTFAGCTLLTEITVPEGVTHIGEYAFSDCREMINIFLPASLEYVDIYCFSGNTTANLYFAGTMDQWASISRTIYKAICSDGTIRTWGSYGNNHFYTMTEDGILRLTGTGAVPDISDKGSVPWSGWPSSFVHVILPEDIPNIGRRMFEGAYNLKTMTIPATVTTIGEKAFYNCGDLDITYDGTMEQWLAMRPDNADINSVTCTDGVILSNGSCGENVRYMLTGDGQFVVTGTGAMTDYSGYSSTPWYKHRSKIRGISIDSGVTSIGSYSFYDSDDLTKVSMAETVTAIGKCAFYDCDALPFITLGYGVETIGENAFRDCDALSGVTLYASVKVIGNGAFNYCKSLHLVQIEDLGAWCGITFGNSSAHPLCYGGELRINSVVQEYAVIPDGTPAINAYAFYNCRPLRELTIPASVSSIGEYAFKGCSNLELLRFGGTVDQWLAMCPNNERTVICADDTILRSNVCGENAHCVILESGKLEINGTGAVTSKQWNDYYQQITEVIIAPGITEIGNYMFSNLNNLISVSIPDSVTTIGREAFYGCATLEEITIPASVQSIGDYAFSNCNGLKTINFEHVASDSLSIGNQAFHYNGNFSGNTGANRWVQTSVGVPYDRVINESIRGYNWTSCQRRPVYHSTRVLPAQAIEIVPVDGITVIEAGLDICFNVNFTPAEATSNIIWTILEDESTGGATINEYGVLFCHTPGIVVVQAQAHDSGVTDEIAITIQRPTAEAEFVEVYVEEDEFNEAAVGTTVQMTADVYPGNTADKRVTWSVENGSGTATIDEDGCLTALTTGSVTVYAEAVNGVVGSCVVDIIRYVEDFDFTFSGEETTRTYAVGERVHIAGISVPADATEPYPEWTITGGTADVNFRGWYEGIEITGLTSGSITIEARSRDNRRFTTTVELHFDENLRGEYILPGGGKLLYNTQTGTITGAEGTLGAVTIPAKIGDTVITAIAPYAFVTRSGGSANGNENLTSLVIPASVETIGDYAFYNCDKLANVRFMDGSALKSIGHHAFYDCDKLATVTYTGTELKVIDNYAFYDCDSLTGMNFPAGIERVGKAAFLWCSSFRSLTIPEGLTDIGEDAFEGLESLEKLTMRGDLDGREWLDWRIVDELTLTGESVIGFVQEGENEQRLPGREGRTVILADTITRIEDDAFADLDRMTSITLSSNLTYIGNDAFRGCRGLTSIELPDTVEHLGKYAFAWCENLTELNIPASLKSIGQHCFIDCYKLQLIDMSAVPDVLKGRLNMTETPLLPEWLVRCASDRMEPHWDIQTIDGQPMWHDLVDWYGNQDGEWLVPRASGVIRILFKDEYTGARGFKDVSVQPGLEITCDNGNKMAAGESKQLYLVNTDSEHIPAFWSLRDKDLQYASIDDNGLLKAKSVDAVREIVVTAFPRDGGSGIQMTFYITPKATRLILRNDDTIVGESGKSVQTLSVDMQALPQMLLRVTAEPEESAPGIVWSSSTPAVVAVDEGGMLTFLKPGTATIKATAAGTSVSVSVKFDVVFVESTKTLTASAVVPAEGLQSGQSVQMQVFGKDKTNALDPAMFEYSIPAAQQTIATVDENGIITAGETAGTVTVTATLANDPLKRKATVKVKVIPLQTERLELHPAPHPLGDLQQLDESGSKWLMVLDRDDLDNGIGFQIGVVGYDVTGQILSPAIKWATTDKTVAQIQTNENGDTFAIVQPNAIGSCTLQAKVSDLIGATAEVTIQIRDYSPRLGTNSFTLNSFQGGTASAVLVESYGNTITEAHIYEYRKDQDLWVQPEGLSVQVAQGQLKITADDVLTAGKYDLVLDVLCANGKNYTYNITVKVENKLPTVTVKQKAKFNQFYLDSEAQLTITAKDAVVADVFITGNDDFTVDMFDGVAFLRYSDAFKADPSASVNKKAVLEVYLSGYSVPVTKSITISTANTAPKLTQTPASSTINTALGEDPSTLVKIYDATNGCPLDMETSLQQVTASFADATPTADGLLLTLNGTSGGTASITVRAEGWTQSVTLKHKVTVQNKMPTMKLASSSLKLNRILPENTASTKVTLNQSNLELWTVDIVSAAAEGTTVREEADKLNVYYDDGYIYAEIMDPDDAPKAATYTFYCTGILPNGQELAKATLKVGVGATAPKIKLKQTTLNLNTCLAGTETASTTVTLTGADGYVLTGFEIENSIDGLDLYMEDGNLKAELTDAGIRCTSYKLKLIPMIMHEETGREFPLTSKVSVTVKVYNSAKFSLSLSTAGKLDTIDPNSALLYTITKMTNISGEVEGVSLAGNDARLFHVELVEGSAKPQVRLSLLPGQEYATNKTYKVQLELSVCGQDVLSKELSIRVTQSKLKVTVPKTVNYYLSQTAPLEIPLQVAAPAEIWHAELGSKSSAELKKAITEVDVTEDGRILLTMDAMAGLTKGKSYTLYLDVTPANNAENVAPTQVKLNIKVNN